MPLVVDTSGTRLGSKDHGENIRHMWEKLFEISRKLAEDCFKRLCENPHEQPYLYYTKTSGENPGKLVVLSWEESEQEEFNHFILANQQHIQHGTIETIQNFIYKNLKMLEILPNEDYSYLQK